MTEINVNFECILANQTVDIIEDNDATDVNASCDGDDEEKEEEVDFLGPSDALKELMKFLEFNAIDMYRLKLRFIKSLY